MNRTTAVSARDALALVLFAAAPNLLAQAAPTSTPSSAPAPAVAPETVEEEEIINLDPFTVSAEEDAGAYRATATLAGSRVRTEMRDVASSISVVTSEFLKNTGATNNQDLLVYTANTEVGGVFGNYAGVGGTFIDGANESSNFVKPSNNTRVRGLDSADNTRDFFATDIPWDSYIVGRVDLQRGPNSILFGIGSPAGIINSSLNGATFKTGGNVENRLGSFGTVRFSGDYNHVLLPKELSLRVAALDDHTKYRQKPAYNHDKRLFGALRWDPKLLKQGSASTSLRANFERGYVRANRPRVLPPQDRISTFFDPKGLNKQTYDPYYTWQAGIIGYPSSNALPAGATKNFWLVQYPGPGISMTANPTFAYVGAGAATPTYVRSAAPQTYWGVSSTGARDSSIDGFPYGSNIGIGSFNEYAYNHWRTYGDAGNPLTGEAYPAADKGFYKTKVLTDTSIFDFYNNLIDGPNKREWQNWNAYNLNGQQTFLNNRIGVELAYDYQDYNDGQTRNLNNPFIGVDVRKNLMVYPWVYTNQVVANPNAGRAFVGGNSKNGGNSSSFTTRENIRATAFGELRATDFLDKGFLSDLLGRHVVTGLYSKETYTAENRNWIRYAVDKSWSDANGSGDVDGGSKSGGLSNGDVTIDWVTYLSGDLSSRTSASGLNLGRITAEQSPSGTWTIPYFDSHWNSTVDPSTPWLNTARGLTNNPVGEASTESENPLNYRGWVNGNFNVLNADRGDIDRLYTDVSKIRKETTSKGITLQSYLWSDTIVGTWGWREDRQKLQSGSSASSGWTAAQANPDLLEVDPNDITKGSSISWGVVVHSPRAIRNKLPFNSNVSLTFSDGRNTRVENRYDFNGSPVANAKGRTKDIGVVLDTLDGRLQFKATYYKTTVKDANLSSVTTEVSTLGNSTYYFRNLEAWGTASALLNLAGRDGGAAGWEWYWNWALVDGNTVAGAENMPGAWSGDYNDPNGAAFLNHPSTAKQTAAVNSWLSQMQPQSWFDAYGFQVDVTKAKAGDWRNAITGWSPYSGVGGLQAQGGGRVKGVWPTGTVDNESKGWEFEVVGSPVKGLNISLNASKTHASQTALGASLSNFIETQYQKFQSAAGDLRLWWGGDATVRQYYTQNIWSAYQFQLQTNGKMVAEMAPWRANLVTNYNFSQSSRLKGVNVGFGYRWEDKRILGYGLNAKKDNLDVDSPIWSKTEDSIDFWAGYERKLTNKINWRLQLNLRNVGEKPSLIPISVQPNGDPAAFRIKEGMVWTVTNTLSF